MREPATKQVEITCLEYGSWLCLARARLCRGLASLLQRALTDENSDIAAGVEFLLHAAESDVAAIGHEYADRTTADLLELLPSTSPLGRLVSGYRLTPMEVELIILSGLPEIHEGYADLLRAVNPERRPRTATGLAAQLLCPDGVRDDLEYALQSGNAVASGLIRLTADGPIYTRHLLLADAMWSVLNGIDAWPKSPSSRHADGVGWGLDEWLSGGDCRLAVSNLRHDRAVTVFLQSDDIETAANRAAVLTEHVGRSGRVFRIDEQTTAEQLDLAGLHCRARNAVPIFVVEIHAPDRSKPIHVAPMVPGPVIIACLPGDQVEVSHRAVLNVDIRSLDARQHVDIWRRVLGERKAQPEMLATRFPVEPHVASRIVEDLAGLTEVTTTDVAKQMRARSTGMTRPGIKLVHPKADWAQLVLPEERLGQLRESVERLHLQSRVFNDWGFLKDRYGARGVRLLFAGPPGTGKTLSAEVLAKELGVDLLIVDISRVVSKWIGETEKNLEQTFAAAERTRAVLLFDEADALFGKRTEVSDAHDRYANLETAYLLTRLERFEGLAVMSSNLRSNIDSAFTRRLEYIIDFDEPDRRERLAIWRCHVPETAPLDSDVNFAELAAAFPVVGGVIRNAALAAAFRAAGEGRSICRSHFVHALRREYEKQGKSFPLGPQGNIAGEPTRR